MATLHIFGDSFFEEWPWDRRYDPPNTWQRQLAQQLNVPIRYHGLAGSAVDYTIKQYYYMLSEFTPDDYIIVGITNHARLYSSLMEKDGCAAALLMSDEDSRQHHGPHWKKAVDVGMRWFMDEQLNQFHILNFLHAVNYHSEKLRHKPLIVECFGHSPIKRHGIQWNNISFAEGSLYEPCKNEFKTQADIEHHQRVPGDHRANHFSWPNHDVLASKYYNHFTNRAVVDLTHGFVEKIVSLT